MGAAFTAEAVTAGARETTRAAVRHPDFSQRPRAHGKFLFVGGEKYWVKGVSYGAFRPDAAGREYTRHEVIERDFAQMAASGVNTVRIPHTVPPRALLDIAQRHGLHVMVGLSAEQYAGFLIDRESRPDVEAIIAEKVRSIAGHPALLCYAVGNEIAAPLVRWIGRRRIERYIERVFRVVKREDPEALVTYVNYPTTEYLDLPFLDLVAFNVYLEAPERLTAYLARLQSLAGERPLVMSEIGLDSLRNGEPMQAASLAWQIRTVFAAGCAGTVVFSWTDEWYRAEAEVEDWAFGLTTRDRQRKPALAAVEQAFAAVPFASDAPSPRISVVVCSFNGSATIRDTLEALGRVDYPDFEVIVVNDGSTDATPEIAREYPVRLISTENRGLSAARNTGWQEATGEIVAYIDDDAYPDPHWLRYLAHAFTTTGHVGVGGPNLAPPGDGWIAECVANAPGGPVHVLITDTLAEHIPGCNMAFRRAALAAIDGFDPRYRTAGDDVDLCWRLQARGGTIGFHAAAMVWHHRRNSLRAYWRQQFGYGRAEALLESKWPEKYNAAGHTTWNGRLYGRGFPVPLWQTQHVYHGVLGMAPFQSLYQQAPSTLVSLFLMPEWLLLVCALAATAVLGLAWEPLYWAGPLALAAFLPLIGQAVLGVRRSLSHVPWAPWSARRLRLWVVAVSLHLVQPIARLRGRVHHGLTPWRWRGPRELAGPVVWSTAIWTTQWAPPESRHEFVENRLRSESIRVVRGGPFDRWDLAVVPGFFGLARMLMAVEDHGGGAQYIRARVSPGWSVLAMAATGGPAALAAAAAFEGRWLAAAMLACLAGAAAAFSAYESAIAAGALRRAVVALKESLGGDAQ